MKLNPLLTLLTGAILAAPSFAQMEIVNGDAEDGTGGTGTVVAAPGWTQTGEFTVTLWNSAGWMAPSAPGPADRGLNYFSGGLSLLSTASQVVDLSSIAADIDAGQMGYDLNGWLGGWLDQIDAATVFLDFLDAGGASVGGDQIGPVTPVERSNLSGLLERNTFGVVPTGTRSVEILIEMVKDPLAPTTYYNDGYADNIELYLIPVGGPKLLASALVSGSPATLDITGATPNSQVRIGYSLFGGGPTPSGFGTVLMAQPIVILADVATSASGAASLTTSVPAAASGRSVWLQCLDLSTLTLSNGLAEVIL